MEQKTKNKSIVRPSIKRVTEGFLQTAWLAPNVEFERSIYLYTKNDENKKNFKFVFGIWYFCNIAWDQRQSSSNTTYNSIIDNRWSNLFQQQQQENFFIFFLKKKTKINMNHVYYSACKIHCATILCHIISKMRVEHCDCTLITGVNST